MKYQRICRLQLDSTSHQYVLRTNAPISHVHPPFQFSLEKEKLSHMELPEGNIQPLSYFFLSFKKNIEVRKLEFPFSPQPKVEPTSETSNYFRFLFGQRPIHHQSFIFQL